MSKKPKTLFEKWWHKKWGVGYEKHPFYTWSKSAYQAGLRAGRRTKNG